jgi:hypothetical protein
LLQQLADLGFLEEGVGDGVWVAALADSIVGCQLRLIYVGVWEEGSDARVSPDGRNGGVVSGRGDAG